MIWISEDEWLLLLLVRMNNYELKENDYYYYQ